MTYVEKTSEDTKEIKISNLLSFSSKSLRRMYFCKTNEQTDYGTLLVLPVAILHIIRAQNT